MGEGTVTLAVAHRQFVAWLERRADLSPHTKRAYASDVASLVRVLGSSAPVAGITQSCIEGAVREQLDEGISSASLRRRVVGLRVFFGWLSESGVPDENPMDGLEFRFRRSRRLPRALDSCDALRLLKQAELEWQQCRLAGSATGLVDFVAISLMLASGLRACEVVAVRREDVALESRSLRVVGKGDRERVVFWTMTSWSKRQHRSAPATSRLRPP